MSNIDDNMKVTVMTMPSEDAVQLVLDSYDSGPKPRDPKKLLSSRPVNAKALDLSELSKKYGPERNLIDLNLGELLSLGMLAYYFRQKDKKLYDLVLSVDDSWDAHRETVISDGALQRNGESSRMIVQQVLAQNIAGDGKVTRIEEHVIQRIADKNEKMRQGSYPDKTALLISVYTNTEIIDLSKIIDAAELTAFPSYFLVQYQIPGLEFCYVSSLGGAAIPSAFVGDTRQFILKRYKNPYEENSTK